MNPTGGATSTTLSDDLAAIDAALDAEEAAIGNGLDARILSIMRARPNDTFSPALIAKALGFDRKRVCEVMVRLASKKQILRTFAKGKYSFNNGRPT